MSQPSASSSPQLCLSDLLEETWLKWAVKAAIELKSWTLTRQRSTPELKARPSGPPFSSVTGGISSVCCVCDSSLQLQEVIMGSAKEEIWWFEQVRVHRHAHLLIKCSVPKLLWSQLEQKHSKKTPELLHVGWDQTKRGGAAAFTAPPTQNVHSYSLASEKKKIEITSHSWRRQRPGAQRLFSRPPTPPSDRWPLHITCSPLTAGRMNTLIG